jgi:phosphoglycolate phosphatase-like HAD superfamily hydrolase
MNESRLAIVFDYDGTLIDTMKIKATSYLEAFETVFNGSTTAKEKILASHRRTSGAHRFIQLFDTLETLGLTATDEQRKNWSDLYSSLNSRALKDVALFPSVKQTLTSLRERGFQLFAVSGIPEEEFLGELSSKKLTSFFVEAKGVDKQGFLNSLEERGFRIVLFVGDTSYDEKAAADAGVPFYWVENDGDIRNIPSFVEKTLLQGRL